MPAGKSAYAKSLAGRAAALLFCAACLPIHAQIICGPYPRPGNPAPIVRSPHCLARILREFGVGRDSSTRVLLKKGAGYWVSASGCPKTGDIGLSVLGPGGEVLKWSASRAPSFCFTPQATGTYTVRVVAHSLRRGYSSGTIDACIAASGCR